MRLALGCCLILAVLCGTSCGDKPDVYNISVPNLTSDADEAIISFEMEVTAGSVTEITNVPFGWNLTLDNNVGWHSSLRAKAAVGAASLAADEIKRMVLVVRRNEAAGGTFNVVGDFTVAKPFEQPRKIPVTMKDFVLNGAG